MNIEFRTTIWKRQILDILRSSLLFGLVFGGVCTMVFFATHINFDQGDSSSNKIILIILTYGLFFAGCLIFGLSFQFLGPLVSRFTRTLTFERKKTITLVVAGILSVGAVVGIYFGWQARQAARQAPFMAHMDEYLAQPTGKLNDAIGGYVRGKVITINVDTKAIDDLYLSLNSKYQPNSPEDVGTVVWLKYGEHDVAALTNGGKTYAVTCDVTVIDLAQSVIVAEKQFTGDDPIVADHAPEGQNFVGPKPDEQVDQFISGLPQK